MELPVTRRRRSQAAADRLAALTRRAYATGEGLLPGHGDDVLASPQEEASEATDASLARHARRKPANALPRWGVSRRAALMVLALLAGLVLVLALRAWGAGQQHGEVIPLGGAGAEQADGGSRGTAEASSTGDAFGDGSSGGSGGATGSEDAAGAEGDHAGDGSAQGAGASASDASGNGGAGGSATLLVHVAGAVNTPGVVSLTTGARVADAITAAGGTDADADLDAINLARPVADGEQVYVPRPGEAPPSEATGAAGDGSDGSPGVGNAVNLNTADLTQLQTLPGVGPAIAQRIVDWREANGGFHTVEELVEVSGIGPKTLDRLRDQVTV